MQQTAFTFEDSRKDISKIVPYLDCLLFYSILSYSMRKICVFFHGANESNSSHP